jgi:3,4-dihydroxy 2-butanone 4-phosphate synthase/GTP cyclohydrolase II
VDEAVASERPEVVEERVEAVVSRLRQGELAALVDAGRRRGQGSLVVVGEAANAVAMARLMELGGGLLVLCMSPERFDQLGLETLDDALHRGEGAQGFGMPIQARGVGGVSAADRAATVAAAVAPDATRDDLVTPGSVFPARAGARGLFSKRRRIEAAVDLSRLAGSPTGTAVLCEILGPTQEVLHGRQLELAVAEEGIPLATVEDVLRYRRLRESIIDPPVVVKLPTTHGVFEAAAYYDSATDITHMALWSDGNRKRSGSGTPPRSYVHDACPLGDALGSCPCGCGERILVALEDLARGELDVVVYQGSGEPWSHLLGRPAPLEGPAAPDLDKYGIIPRILRDFADGRTPADAAAAPPPARPKGQRQADGKRGRA